MSIEEFKDKGIEYQDDVKSGENYDAWRMPSLSPEDFSLLSAEKKLSYLVACAGLAPSTHNTQPWAFKISPLASKIEVYLDRGAYQKIDGEIKDERRVLLASDVKGRQACISLGCALANLTVAASYLGLKADIALEELNSEEVKPINKSDDSKRYISIGTVDLSKLQGEPGDRKLFEAIFTRKMNRGEYSQKRIDEEILAKIEQIGLENETRIKILDRAKMIDMAQIRAIAELQAQADSYVANKQSFAKELADWFLPNNTNSFLGMPGDTFGLQEEQAIRFHKGLKGEVELKAEEKAGLAQTSRKGIESASLVGIITVREDVPEKWIRAGLTLEKIALLLEKNKIGFAVHAALAEVDIVRRCLPGTFFSRQYPAILFRAGFSDSQKPHSPRFKQEMILLD